VSYEVGAQTPAISSAPLPGAVEQNSYKELMKNEQVESTAVVLAKESTWAWECRLVRDVVKAYGLIKELPVLGAVNPDPSPVTHARRWSPDSAHFCIDVDHAVRDACNGDFELQAPWKHLLVDETVIRKADAKLIRRLARLLEARGLHPAKYFRKIHHGSPQRRAA
jgi:hypothetical protein